MDKKVDFLDQQKYLLIIDEDTAQYEQINHYFTQFNYVVVHHKHAILSERWNYPLTCILINQTLINSEPGLIAHFQQNYHCPIIVISNEVNEDRCIALLEAGTDDFLVKPLNLRELHARINAINRRLKNATKEREQEEDIFIFAQWRLYLGSRRLFNQQNKECHLSNGEYDLLLAFLQQPQRILAREFLLQATKNSDLTPFDRRIDIQISRLRQKIELDAKRPALIKTIRNGGYLFTSAVTKIKSPKIHDLE